MALKFTPYPSPNWDQRNGAINLIVLHYTGMQDEAVALARLCDPAPVAGRYPGPWQDALIDPATPLGRVSAHYVVGAGGTIYQLVEEGARAWHAGVSTWEGRSDTNDRSIGIEIANGGHDFGLPEFPDAQIAAVIALVGDILRRHSLGPDRVVGHSDVAPARKLDPGEKFPWRQLAHAGYALWPAGEGRGHGCLAPGDAGEEVAAAQAALAAFGYDVPDDGFYGGETSAAVAAFQRRFRPTEISGLIDGETAGFLVDLVAQKQRLTLLPSQQTE
jgi:N-acetylmuramoyl-L-alanine amidase